ncbi:MAG: FHA domain-containing protein [Pseudomonadota bacterium]
MTPNHSSKSDVSIDPQSVLLNASETIKHAGEYVVEITAGVHAGAKIQQKSGTVTIGTAKDNDLVLFGSQIAPHHVEITLPKNIMGKLVLKPVDMPVQLDDGSVVEVGQYAEIDVDHEVSFGDVQLTVMRIADPRRYAKPGVRFLAILCLLAMIPVGYSLLSDVAISAADAGSRAISTLNNTISSKAKTYLASTNAEQRQHTEAFAWTVRTRLEDLKLNHRLRVLSTSDGSIRVYGNISDAELPRWTAFLQWYDTTSDFPPLIRDVNRTTVDRNLPQIKSVWLDQEPTVFFKDGSVANIGTEIKDGWRVVNINSASIMLERDGAVVSLTY